MSQTLSNTNQEWLKVLGKGMVTIPKQWREELGLQEGDIVRAKKEGNRLVIEPQKENLAPYRVYSNAEVKALLEEDKLPQDFYQKVKEDLYGKASQ